MREVECELHCGKYVVLNEMEIHIMKHCSKRVVACPNAIRGCMWRGGKAASEEHAQYHCKKRIVTCRVGCGTELPFEQQVEHEQNRSVLSRGRAVAELSQTSRPSWQSP